MASAAAQLKEVDALREARLEALDQALQQELASLQHQAAVQPPRQQQQPQTSSTQACPTTHCCCPAAAQLQEARLQAADDRYNLQLTQLELLKQLDALQELQWQLDCVVAQLGLQPPQSTTAHASGLANASNSSEAAPAGVDHMLLLSKVEELRMAQVQVEEYKRRLAFAESELAASTSRFMALEEQQQRQQQQQFCETTCAVQHSQCDAGQNAPAQQYASSCAELGAGGRELVAALLQENEQLRQQAAEAQERYQSLERDYEVELLLKAEAEEQGCSRAAAKPPRPAHKMQMSHSQTWERHQQDSLHTVEHFTAEAVNSREGSPSRNRRQQEAASPRMEHIARQRLEVRLRDKDAQLSKLRKVVQQLEGKLIDAYKRQADLVMKESSWREQEAQDRHIAGLEEEKARLAFAAQEAKADADAARKEAAAQRKLAARLQQRMDAAEREGSGSSAQVAELLQKRVKVLEAQCMRLHLQARSRREEEEEEEAAATATARAVRQQRRGVAAGVGAAVAAVEAGRSSDQGAAAGENNPPNKNCMMEGNPVLEQWQAGKRLQKKVEALQAKLRDKTTALVSAQAGRDRAEEEVAQLQASAEQHQVALKQLQAQLRQAEQRSTPGAMVDVNQWRELLQELEQLQQKYNALERQHALLQHQRAGSGQAGKEGCNQHHAQLQSTPVVTGGVAADLPRSCSTRYATPPIAGAASPGTAECTPAADGLLSGTGKPYCPHQYGGATVQPAEADPAALLLEKDVQLFDATVQRDQAAQEAERYRRRLHSLLEGLRPHPHDKAAAEAIAEARQLAGLPPLPCPPEIKLPAVAAGSKPTGTAVASGKAAGTSTARRRLSGVREQELLDTIELLKSALERAKKGLESGVTSAKYMQAVDKAKQLKAKCQQLEDRLEGTDRVREELSRVQQQLGVLHGTNAALKSQLKAVREQREEAASAREQLLSAQVAELERTLRERDAQMEALNASTAQVDEEVRVLVTEGLRPADLVQELLMLRPRLRELEKHNAALQAELAAFDAHAFAQQLEQLAAEHDLLRRRCRRWEAEARALCERHGEPLPLDME